MTHKLHILLILLIVSLAGALPAAGQDAEPSVTYRLYLPQLATGAPPPTVFGLEMSRLEPARGLSSAAQLAPTWVRRNGLLWSDIEPTAGAGYRWNSPALRALEQEMIQASNLGMRMVLVVRGSPAWATAPYTNHCAPINPEHYDAFAAFLRAAVARYSRQPYNVQYWELGNEPDAPVVQTDQPYGCWGQPDDTYYGGRAYGAMLKLAYPAIKAANPQAQVLNGGLLLDRPYDPVKKTGQSARFLEGMLEAGAGNSFDLLSYHSYSFYDGTPDGSSGSNDWKPAYLRALLRRYSLEKPLINTEGALLCRDSSPACDQAQARAIPRIYARAMRDGLLGFTWYIYDSDVFHNTALIDPGNPQQLRPAHRAYEQARTAFGGASYAGAVPGLPTAAEGYRFAQGRSVTLLVWSNVVRQAQISVGTAASLRCVEWDGTPLPCAPSAGRLTIELRPAARYITFTTP